MLMVVLVRVKMTPVCPFIKGARPDDASSRKPGENQNKAQADHGGRMKSQSGDSAVVSPHCPFGYDSPQAEHKESVKSHSGDSAVISPKCPFGYDSQTFKLGPFSCMICRALLFQASQCVPCSHRFCKLCMSRFQDCPLCGADIEKIEPDSDLQKIVDRFIEGHARIKRSHATPDAEEVGEKGKVVYEDVSLERGAFLVQQAMRAFRANNVESAKSRLGLCADDIREQIKTLGRTRELCSQLGAVLGMLGDCWFVLSLPFALFF
ncbi:hypothetical protein RJ641_012036 [Dillenia turbinata]|uniref:RING-type domain-containing protein n=1 Tax=Dillenia turbinata TaxID=194707 RepID=A0AAN8UYF1_9MAGN